MKKTIKILIFTIISFIIITALYKVNAASASINASKTTITEGESVTINVPINAAAWNINLSGAVSKKFAGNSDDAENISKTESVTFTPSGAGTYTVNLGGDVSDGKTDVTSPVSGKVTITVNAKEQPAQQTQTQTQTQTQQTTTQQNQQPAQQTQTPKEEEPNFTNANQTMYTTGNINLRSSWSTSSAATSVPAGTEVTVLATSTNKVNGYVWYKVSYNGQTKYVASGLLTSTKPDDEAKKKEEEEAKKKEEEEAKKKEEEANTGNKALKKLEVEGYTLDPVFNPETTRYTINLKEDFKDDKLKINAEPSDENAKVNIEGNENFSVGNSIVKITVTAKDGTTRLYTITVIKAGETAEVDELKLSSLTVAKGSLDPSFDKDVKSYIIGLEDPSSFTESDVTALAEESNIDITISSGKLNDNGEQLITIYLASKDEKDQRTGVYQITVKKATIIQEEKIQKNADKKMYYIFGGIIAVLVILIIIVIIALKKTSDDDYDDDDYDDEDDEDFDDDDDGYEDGRNQRNNAQNSRYDHSLKKAIDEANSLYDYDSEQDTAPKSQILSRKIPPKSGYDSMDETQLFTTEKFNEVSENNSRRRGRHF